MIVTLKYLQKEVSFSRQILNPLAGLFFKTNALSVIGNNNEFNDFYEELIKKNLPPHTARNATN